MQLTKRMKDISGQTFGSITALHPVSFNQSGEVVWECVCACGNSVFKSGPQLKAASNKHSNPQLPSCGCVKKVLARKQAITTFTKHGYATHANHHPLYKLYQKVRSRCYNPNDTNFHLYGAKGVTMCTEWYDHPDVFIEWCLANGWEPKLQLDKDILCDSLGISPKMYSPETCQFVTQHVNLIKSASRDTYGSNRNIKLSHADVAAMQLLYAQGMKKAHIAKQFGIGKTHATRLIPTHL